MANTSDIRKGICIRYNNDIYKIVEFLHVKPGKGPAFVTLDRDGQTVMLECRPVLFAAKKTWTIYFWVDDIEAAYAEFTSRDAVLKGPIVDKFYGCREIAVIAPDGRVIVFGQLGSD